MVYKYAYIVEFLSKHGKKRYYVGGTNNPRQRIADHAYGRGARVLRGRTILRVAITTSMAEHDAKKLRKAKRVAMLDGHPDWRLFWRQCPGCPDLPSSCCHACTLDGMQFLPVVDDDPAENPERDCTDGEYLADIHEYINW